MRVLIENGGYQLGNFGDIAMLQACVRRIRSRHPQAKIFILTKQPDRLARFVPGAVSVDPQIRDAWLKPWNVFNRGLCRILPGTWKRALLAREREIRLKNPLQSARRIEARFKRQQLDSSSIHQFLDLLSSMDLVIACGGGYITDEFRDHASIVLQTLGTAMGLGRPFALFGQGIGPIHVPEVLKLMRFVLPQARTIALREALDGPAACRDVGVSENTVVVTGDDAIDCACDANTRPDGIAVGLNLRVARYSGMSLELAQQVSAVVKTFTQKHRTGLQPIPISRNLQESDIATVTGLLQLSDAMVTELNCIETPEQAIGLIKRCRFVVTGSYHAGVFALAQGIPVVSLAVSDYYVSKFSGLTAQFGTDPGRLIRVGKADWQRRLEDAMARCWAASEEERQRLREAARLQIISSESAYAKVLNS